MTAILWVLVGLEASWFAGSRQRRGGRLPRRACSTNRPGRRPVLAGMAGFASVFEEEGVVMRSAADVNGFTIGELRFPAGYVQAPFEPDLPYLAVVIGGALEKSFSVEAWRFTKAWR